MEEEKLIQCRDDRIKQSKIVGEKMYGKNWENIVNNIKELDPNFAELLQEIPYGTVYPREQLSLKYREIAAISVLTQLNLKPQLKSHILAGIKVGLSREEIMELFSHLAMFIGFPLTLDGLQVAKEVFDHLDSKNK